MNQYKVMENVVQNDKFLLKVKDEVEFCEFRVNFVFQICSFFFAIHHGVWFQKQKF